jgi:segregation and condensation protein A
MTYQVKLREFEGPLPLLLELIEKQKLDVTTVSLAQVADDFLAYIENGKDINLANLSEFLLIASHLILIKSKALLPFFEFTKEEEEDIEDLEGRLREYRRFKKAAQALGEKWLKQDISFSKSEEKVKVIQTEMPDISNDNLYKLILGVIEKNKKEEEIEEEILEVAVSLEEKITDLRNAILKRAKISFNETIKDSKNKIEIVVSFLAVLEMMKQKFVTVKQVNAFDDIVIEKIKTTPN